MEEILKLADNYRESAVLNRAAHYRAANDARRKHIWMGIPAIIISTAIGTGIFTTLNGNPDTRIKIAAGLIALVGAVLSALQTFFGFSETAQKHRIAGAAYGDIRRRLEIFRLKYSSPDHLSEAEAINEITKICDVLAGLAKESPNIPDEAYKEAMKIETSRSK